MLLVAALTVFAMGNVAPAGATVSIGPQSGVLRVLGDGQNDTVDLRVSKQDPSLLEFDVNNDDKFDGTVPLGSFNGIQAIMGAGNDTVRIDDSNGSFTDQKPTAIAGGDGGDVLIGGKGNENLAGGAGNDTLIGRQGNDLATGEVGEDSFVWTAGDGIDTVSGGAGSDIVGVRGNGADETIAIAPSSLGVRLFHKPSSGMVEMIGIDDLDVATFGGNDFISAAPEVGAQMKLTFVAAGATLPDDDVVIGSDSADTIGGGVGVDRLEGRGGDDVIDAGDGDDTLLGGTGKDAMTGGAGADAFDCDVAGEALDLGPLDFTKGMCSAVETPPVSQPPASEPPPTAPPAAPAAEQPAALGFGKPVVRATREGLRVTLRNTSASKLSVSVKVAERFGGGRTLRYRVVRKTIPAGGRSALRLRAPRSLRTRIASQLDRLGRVVRRPSLTVTNVGTAGRLFVRPRLTLRTH